MARRLVFTGKQEVALETFNTDNVGENSVRLRSICSLMSTGTENICFNRLFDPGTHWDNWVKYPFYPGYSMIAEVAEIGAKVTHLKVGDRVAARKQHMSEHVMPANDCYLIPPELDATDAAWFALAKITFMGARAADYKLGDSVVIIGAGPIGQMSVRWAAAAGCQRIIVADMVEMRLAQAKAGGATHVITAPIDRALEEIKAANGGEAPTLVMDSTGNEHVFTHALALCGRRGKVIIMGDTGSPSRQHISSDVITKGISIIGAHDGHNDAKWNDATVTALFFQLLKLGRMNVKGLNTHTFTPEECKKAYGICNTQRGQTMGIIFDWKK